jgi:hypothetical protein
MRTRTSEGRAGTEANGAKIERKFKLTAQQRKEGLARKKKDETLTVIAASYNVSHSNSPSQRPRVHHPEGSHRAKPSHSSPHPI